MPNLLTIPIEVRAKILNYAISDLYVDDLAIKRVDADYGKGVWHSDSTVWKGDYHHGDWTYLKNPNVNIPLICRQICNECKSTHIRKPKLEAVHIATRNFDIEDVFWPFLNDLDLDIPQMMSQLSLLQSREVLDDEGYDEWLHPDGNVDRDEKQAVEKVKGTFGRVFAGYISDNYDIEITKARDGVFELMTTLKPY